MSTELIKNQPMREALSVSVATPSQVNQANKRQDVAVEEGKSLPSEAPAEKEELSTEELQQVVEKLNEHVQQIHRDLQFSVDDSSGRTVVRVVNSETEEVVRQIPSEEVLRISRNLKDQTENVSGLLFETSA
jgi:flagellar protein FlaG